MVVSPLETIILDADCYDWVRADAAQMCDAKLVTAVSVRRNGIGSIYGRFFCVLF